MFDIMAKYVLSEPSKLEDWEASHRGSPHSATTIGSIVDAGNGTYFAFVRPKISGVHELAVTIHDLHIKGSPFLHVVESNAAVAYASSADWGPGLETATVNVATNFTATARDAYGNSVLGEDEYISCGIISDTNGSCSNSFGNGSTICTYTPLKSGQAELEVRYRGAHVMGSPFRVHISDGAVAGNTTRAFGPGLSFAIAGQLTNFSVAASDTGNNRIDDVGLSRVSNFSAVLTHRVQTSQTVTALVHAMGNGIYSFAYNATLAGEYDLVVFDEAFTTDISHTRGTCVSFFMSPNNLHSYQVSQENVAQSPFSLCLPSITAA